VLSAVQEAKEKTEAVIKATKELKKSLMKHLFTYGPVSPKEAGNVALKETEIGMIPEDWEVKRLGDCLQKTKQKDMRKTTEEFYYIDVSSIDRDYLRIISVTKYKGKNAPSRARKIVKENDVIIAIVRPTLKRVALIPKKYDNQVCSTAFCVLRGDEGIDNRFIYYTIQRDTFINALGNIQRGASYPAVTDSDVKNQKIPLPPLPIQQKIAEILSAVDEKIEAEENKKKSLEDLFKTLLNNLMTGKIRVNNLEV
jgi:type I restriction enzyme S subunit